MSRERRHAAILDVLAEGPASSQDALLALLRGVGIETTQATLSRDLRDIGAVKTASGYVHPNAIASTGPTGPAAAVGGLTSPEATDQGLRATRSLERALRGHLITASAGVGMVVCKTAPGHAQVVALELDRTPPEGVIGTVGGDDTIFVAVDRLERVSTLVEDLLTLAGLAPMGADRSES